MYATLMESDVVDPSGSQKETEGPGKTVKEIGLFIINR